MPDKLPKFVSSLSKYIRVEKYYALLTAILHDTPEREFRASFEQDLYATARQRYLIVENGNVLRDKLVDFVHDEGGFTEPVKMVMYFVFMLRDARYREFICRKVGIQDGKWDTSIFRDTHSEHFLNAGGHKAFTNLRQFLFQTGILDEQSLRAHIPRLDERFPAAANLR